MSDLPTADASVFGLSSVPLLVSEHAAEHQLSVITKNMCHCMAQRNDAGVYWPVQEP